MATPYEPVLLTADETFDLRRKVLRRNDPAAIMRSAADDDPDSLYAGIRVGGAVAATAAFYPETFRYRDARKPYRLRGMAVDEAYQGQGLGAMVLAYAEPHLRERGADLLWANARDPVLEFYRKAGFTLVEGSEFVSEETQIPHTVIYKLL